ncbi:protein DpdE [Amycolatopsis marina]|uniref:protein DpdE n=1 Tax=Amycolatopsis marina TaxID=490629 RepID=UPI002481DD9E|nr:protein DpdE [Amycolatopsis marina]
MKSRSNDLGYGFFRERSANKAVVVYHDIPGVTEERALVPLEEVEPARLPKGTRIWLRGDPYGWWAGEITGAAGFREYHIRVPGLSRDFKVSGDRFIVRWNRPLGDPMMAVASGFCDSPEFYDARRNFRDQILRQRSSSRGFTAVLSAAVELFPHQLDTVARVLSDPVLRYLLADEVGLGKTVEAGLIVRQLILDDADATALVSVPTPLVQQWNAELRNRLLLGHALSAKRVRLITHDQLATGEHLQDHAVVVIDEAHKLKAQLERQPRLRTELQATKGLLLLSATPMRGNLDVFLGLLNLLDPLAFPLHGYAAFEKRVQDRENEAVSLQILTTHRASIRQRSTVLDELLRSHGKDPVVMRLIDTCRNDDLQTSPAWSELSNYVRETYRISRRMVRHRRNTESTEDYPVAGRSALFVPIVDPGREVVDEFLDQYRDHLTACPDRMTFSRTVMHGLGGPHALLRHMQRRLDALANDTAAPAADRYLIEATVAKLNLVGTETRQQLVLDLVDDRLSNELKVVVVATSTDVAKDFYGAARERWPEQLSRHLAVMNPTKREDELDCFLTGLGGRLLVGDHTLEEGRNLQDAHVLVNLDLPLDPNRLEQRIGRLDRFARRTEPAEIVVLTEPESEWVMSHIGLFTDGIGIFEDSVATLQRKLSELLGNLTEQLPEQGRFAFSMDLGELRKELEEERIDVDLLEELESVTAASDFDDAGFAELREAEEDPGELRAAFTQLTSMRGGLGLRPSEHPRTGVVRFPTEPGRSIFGTPHDVAAEVLPLLTQPRAYARSVATSRTGIAPLRLGDPMVDWLEQYLRIDERGRARAVVRPHHGNTVATMWLACDFLIEFDATHLPADTEGVRRRLRRRGDALLPPVIVRTWTDTVGPADDELVVELERPFDNRSDRLLNGKLWEEVLAELPNWQRLCTESGEAALTQVRTMPALTTAPVAATERGRAEVSARLAVLRARAQRLPTEAEKTSAQAELAREEGLGNALLKGIEQPSVSVVACGAVVLWPES